LTVEVMNPSGTVAFTFKNTGSTTSIIIDIYFDYDGLFVGNPSLSDSDNAGTAIDIEIAKNPANLPGGNTIRFNEVLNLSSPMKSGVINQINNFGKDGDRACLVVPLPIDDGVTLTDMITAMNENELRIGMHVQSIGGSNGYSDPFANMAATNVVPVPSATFLLLSVCPMLVWGYDRRRRGDTGGNSRSRPDLGCCWFRKRGCWLAIHVVRPTPRPGAGYRSHRSGIAS
jgi:hypothetical protein